MTDDQESHLASIKDAFAKRVDDKYRAGQLEHGGNLYDLSALDLINMAIDEAVDQIAYLVTLKSTMTTQRDK